MKKKSLTNNKIQKTSFLYLWIKALVNPPIFIALFKMLGSIFSKFFFLQFQTLLFPQKRPVINVDHPLDKKIPFDGSWIGLYNSFTVFWMKTAAWLLKEFGKDAVFDVVDFINELTMLYNAAGEIYNKCQSTTDRPSVSANFHFIVIHAFDPHLHCVPSLHVMVCSFTSYKLSKIIQKHTQNTQKYDRELKWAFKNSVEIIESVLLVKQHSVNCISSGFYMNSVIFEDFKKDWASKFLQEMFKDDSKNITNVETIQSYIIYLYNSFIKKFEINSNRNEVLLNFLNNYNVFKKTDKASHF